MSKRELIKRYGMFVLCLFFMGMGVALTKHGELGVSPISSVANVVSCKITALSFGNRLIISNCVLVIGQILLLRKNFRLIQLMQIPLIGFVWIFHGFWNVSGEHNSKFKAFCVLYPPYAESSGGILSATAQKCFIYLPEPVKFAVSTVEKITG